MAVVSINEVVKDREVQAAASALSEAYFAEWFVGNANRIARKINRAKNAAIRAEQDRDEYRMEGRR